MKITAIKSVVVNAEMRNWVFVKVETDQAGLFGWGEASLEWKTRAVVGAIEDLAPMAEGEDPTRIEHLYQKLYRQSFWRVGVIGMSALSGIEQACWDILGKSLGVPVYKLMGGAVRDRVRMYTHLGGGSMKAVYESFDPGPERVRGGDHVPPADRDHPAGVRVEGAHPLGHARPAEVVGRGDPGLERIGQRGVGGRAEIGLGLPRRPAPGQRHRRRGQDCLDPSPSSAHCPPRMTVVLP